MRVFVFLDTPRQSSYIDAVRTALADVPEALVISGGYGVSPEYFGIARDGSSDSTGQNLNPKNRWLRFVKLGPLLARHVWRRLRSATRRIISIFILPPLLQLGRTAPGERVRAVLKLETGRARAVSHSVKSVITTVLRPLIAPLAEIPRLDQVIVQTLKRILYISRATNMLRQARPDILIVMEDNVEGLTGITTTVARRLAIPVVILPDYIPNPHEPAQYYYNSKDHIVRTIQDKLVARCSEKWVFRYRSKDMLRLPSSIIAAYRLLRCESPAPWILNSGYSSVIALESRALLAHYLRLGFDKDKLQVIGTAQDDGLYDRFLRKDQLRADLLTELGLDADRPLILCALPPDQYVGADISRFEYASYQDLVEAWFAELGKAARSANVIVRLHPRTPVDLLRPFCPQGVHILTTPTDHLVPICDLYVASISTTIRWALSLAIPVINYDCYRYAYGDFAKARGLTEAIDRQAFAKALSAFLHDPAFSARAVELAKDDANNWGQVDGHFNDRLRALLEEVHRTPILNQPTHRSITGLASYQ